MFSGWARRMLGAVEEKSPEPPKLPLASRALRSDEAPEAGAETPGSLRHGSECNPCAWYWKPQGCLRGKECGYCHMCPEGEVKLRKKAKLAAMRGGVSPSSTASLSPSKAQRDLVMGQEIEAEVVDRQPSMSVGSTLHGTGECKPCAWFWKPKGCQNGADCRHCHMCSQGEIRLRKKAKERGSREEADRSPLEPLKVSIEGMDEPAYGHEPQWVEPTSLADVAPPPGLAMSSSVPSKGSAAHGTGLCRPCAWLWKPGGCQNGAECRHCHLCPDGELKARRKVKAELARQESLEQEILSSPLALSLAQMLDEDDASPADPFGLDSEGVDAAHIYPSEGSKLHGSGFCRPCAWFWKPKGCDNGRDCHHCHLCPQEEIKNRRKAKQYMQNEGSPMMWPASTWTPLSGVDSMMTQTPGSVYPGSELSESMLTPLELGASPGVTNWDWDAFGAASPESPKFAIELAKSLPVPSSGSELHGTGKCRPCAWFHKSAGCSNGEACAHCHLCPEDEIRSRKKAKEAALRAGALEPKRDADGRNPRTVRIAPLLA